MPEKNIIQRWNFLGIFEIPFLSEKIIFLPSQRVQRFCFTGMLHAGINYY